jgi:hypothetical protein
MNSVLTVHHARPARTVARWIVLVALLVGMLPLLPSRAAANHPWGSYHWYRTGSTITLNWRNQAGSSFDNYIHTALARWASAQAGNWFPGGPLRSDFSLLYTSGGAPSCTRSTDLANGERNVTFCISYGESQGPSEAAIELYDAPYGHGVHIISGLVWMEPAHQNYQSVWCHEAGHTFALWHSTNTASCLYTPSSSHYPDQHDLDLSRTQNYGHVHSPPTTTTTQPCAVPNPLGGCLA